MDELNARGLRLAKIAGDGDMPEGARAGVEKALGNMAAATEKTAWALGRGEAGPPPWAGREGNGNGASQDIVTPPVAEPPVEVPPVATPPDVDATPVAPPAEDLPVEAPPVDIPSEGVPGDIPSLPLVPPVGR